MSSSDNSSHPFASATNADASDEHPAGNNETVLERKKREDAETRAKRKQFLQRIVLRFRLYCYDRVVRRASHVIEDLRRVHERKQELVTNKEEEAQATELRRSRRRAWTVLDGVFVAASADILFILPNIGYALASRFAGGEEPTLWEKICAFGVLEIAIIVLLLTVKSLSYTRPHLEARNRAKDTPEYNAARCRLFGARIARTTYVLLISFAFMLNILAEIGKLDSTLAMLRYVRSSQTTQGGVVIEKEREQGIMPVMIPDNQKGDETGGSFISKIPITAGVSVLIWALHIVVLFLPPGEFARRSVCEFTRAELDRLERALAQERNNSLLRINGKLRSAKGNEQKYNAMIDRTPDAVIKELNILMGKVPTPLVDPAAGGSVVPFHRSPGSGSKPNDDPTSGDFAHA